MQRVVADLLAHIATLDERIDEYEEQIKHIAVTITSGVAIAAKNARLTWAMLANGEQFKRLP